MGERSREKNKKDFIAVKCFSQPKKIIRNERFMKQGLRLSEEDWKQRSRDEVISVSMFFHTEKYWDQSYFHSLGQRRGPVVARHIFTEGQLTFVKISHAKWLVSPVIPGKWLKPVPAGRPAESRDVTGPTCGTREQVSVSCGHTDVLLSKPTNEKWTANSLPLQRSNAFRSWRWLQRGGQIQLGSGFVPFWEELHVSLITAMESNVLVWRTNESQEKFSEYKTYTCIPLLHAFVY